MVLCLCKLREFFLTTCLAARDCSTCLRLLQANGYGGYSAPAQVNGAAHAANHYGAVPAAQQHFAASADAYRAEHTLIVQGDNVPDPLQSFDSAGFSAPIMDEVLQHSGVVGHIFVSGLPP